MTHFSLLGAAAAMLITGAASAATISSTGDFFQIAQPASITNNTPTSNTNILYFNESQNVLLTSDLTTDTGVIPAGTYVDSHMFLLNRSSGSSLLSKAGTLTFSNTILGTMSDINGALLAASDFLGMPAGYTNFNNRGLESNDTIFFSGNTITANLNVTQPGDWVRVVTGVSAVPLPSGAALLPVGLIALGALRRRRKPAV